MQQNKLQFPNKTICLGLFDASIHPEYITYIAQEKGNFKDAMCNDAVAKAKLPTDSTQPHTHTHTHICKHTRTGNTKSPPSKHYHHHYGIVFASLGCQGGNKAWF